MQYVADWPGAGLKTVVCAAGLLLAANGALAQTAAPAPPPGVIVETVKAKDLSEQNSFTGRIEAINKVELKARVAGTLDKREFVEGSKVDQGAVLFVIEKAPYQIAVAQAKAAVADAEASVRLAEVTFDRYKTLSARDVASKAELDRSQAQLDQAKANLEGQKASLQNAELNLSYTDVVAPLTGAIGRASVSVGDYVTLSSGPLATLVQQDPIYATFPVPQRTILEVQRSHLGPDSVEALIILPDGTTYDHPGKIVFMDVSANPSTDTVAVRASVPNPDGVLFDEQIVQVMVRSKQSEERLVVSQAALLLDQQGSYVLAVNGEDIVEARRVKLGAQRGTDFLVEEGLAEGDRVIVSGLQKVRPGMKVEPQEIKGVQAAGN